MAAIGDRQLVTRTPLGGCFPPTPSWSVLLPESLDPTGGVRDRECRVWLDGAPYACPNPPYVYPCSMGGGEAYVVGGGGT